MEPRKPISNNNIADIAPEPLIDGSTWPGTLIAAASSSPGRQERKGRRVEGLGGKFRDRGMQGYGWSFRHFGVWGEKLAVTLGLLGRTLHVL